MLTPAEQRVLQIFRSYTEREGHPPLLREIGQALGIRSKGTLHRYVRSLI
ncbi:MAG: transcriptional repressor LexA, partial [Nitrososphaera sp.]